MIRIRLYHRIAAMSLGVTVLAFGVLLAGVGAAQFSDQPSLSAALCPIVYPLDQFPSAQGSRYFFYGNAFFVNEGGYLITAAHVVSAFRDGGQPYILVSPSGGPSRLQPATIVAEDAEHDVAVLRATPNPFQGEHRAAFLPLATQAPPRAKTVLAVALRPANPQDSNTSEAPREARSSGQVLDYTFTSAETGVDTELLLVSQQIVPGDSGSPLLSADSHDVVGIVVGRWLNSGVLPSAAGAAGGAAFPLSPGAALRIHYALALLRERGIPWHSVPDPSAQAESPAQPAEKFTPPALLSLVTTPYPPQALFGGEVRLDALIDADGKLEDLKVVSGQQPFLEPVLDAVRTWSFQPARLEGRAVEARLGIVFQFPQSFVPPLASGERKYEEPSDSEDRAPLPVDTLEPEYPPNSIADGSVVLYQVVDPQGNVASTDVLRDVASLTAPSVAASRQWRLVPGKQAGTNTESAMVVVLVFRRPALAGGRR